MTRFALFILGTFLTISVGQASDERSDDPGHRVRVSASENNGRAVIEPTEQDRLFMRTHILSFQDELRRIGQEGARRGVPSAQDVFKAERRFKDDILMCGFRQLRGMAYETLSLSVVGLDNFKLAYSYALEMPDESAKQLYDGYKLMHQRIANQSRPEVNADDARMKEVIKDTIKQIDEIVEEERARHQKRIADPNNPQYDYHPLEIKRLQQMEGEATLKTLMGVPKAIYNASKIVLFVYLVYQCVKIIFFKII